MPRLFWSNNYKEKGLYYFTLKAEKTMLKPTVGPKGFDHLFSPLTAGAVPIRCLHFLLAHYIISL